MKTFYYILLTVIIIITVMWFNSEPTVISYGPMHQNTKVDTNITIGFNTNINAQSAIDNLSISPHIEYEWQYTKENKTLIIKPKTDLIHQTTYTVKLSAGVKHHIRKPSTKEFSFEFTTADYNRINITLLGDTVLYHLENELKQENTNYAFEKLNDDILSKDNFIFTNLENPISDRGTEINNKAYRFRSSPNTVEILKHAKINAVALANNHALDYGPDALIDTVSYCKKADITCVGYFKNAQEKQMPPIINYKGIKIGLASYLDKIIVPYWHHKLWQGNANSAGVEFINDNILEDIKYLRDNSDIVIVALHWGIEREKETTTQQTKLAHLLIDNGADIIMGHHPHVVQAVEKYNGGLVFYSLGNFVFPPTNEHRRDTFSAVIKVNKQGIIDTTLYPLTPIEGRPHSMNEQQTAEFYQEIKKLSSKFNSELVLNSTTITVK
ncbi:CapA family protein [Clostridium sp. 'deep sea']|uniref:CapA family protein n=1 Tax=Clostridium sp. 'deep sea' TaxID=2779445 RepID=UPI001896603F|nr:CapA family protein [Clostridium sp. 'deep sea']QOR36712.1 CapA family protein [Clostridium sp. 'deep sea']